MFIVTVHTIQFYIPCMRRKRSWACRLITVGAISPPAGAIIDLRSVRKMAIALYDGTDRIPNCSRNDTVCPIPDWLV